MKKIGLVTIVDYTNYGNRLQNYAAQQVLRSLGCDVVTIVNEQLVSGTVVGKRSLIKRLFGLNVGALWRRMVRSVHKKKRDLVTKSKHDKLKKFSSSHIRESDFVIRVDDIPADLSDAFDAFVVGSDQVWNPRFRKGSPIDFLRFTERAKRVSYSASFGVSEIPSQYRDSYQTWLSEFAHLSVREDSGADIIRQLTGREAAVLCDPTLMLDKDQWLSISSVSLLKPRGAYLLTYFLGGISKEVEQLISRLVKEHHLEVVHLGSFKQMNRYDTDLGEFIDYIQSSFIFLTDSFHGTVFSILFDKPFIVFDRQGTLPSMSSRIDTLLRKFDLMDHKWENGRVSGDVFNTDNRGVHDVLISERLKAMEYLRKRWM
jgi:hypothetical protein